MKFGVREICDVVLKAKAPMMVGNKLFYANEPVMYFDTLKSSSMEGASTTVYATGGRGNTRLMAWEGERTVTFTMEDALLSPEGFMILSGAGLIDASEDTPVYQHHYATVDKAYIEVYGTDVENPLEDDAGYTMAEGDLIIPVDKVPYFGKENEGDYAYVMFVNKGEIISEPYIPVHVRDNTAKVVVLSKAAGFDNNNTATEGVTYDYVKEPADAKDVFPAVYDSVIVDFYEKHITGAQQIEITAESFGGNFYLEASTLFRDTNGSDLPAEFIIPNCKIQSNFSFTMAGSGDPSTFTFTMDAFPDYTRFDHSKKVLAAIQIMNAAASDTYYRTSTIHDSNHEVIFD